MVSGFLFPLFSWVTSVTTPPEHLFIVRSAKPRDWIDRSWEPLASRGLKGFVHRHSQKKGSSIKVHEIALSDIDRLPSRIKTELPEGEALRGIFFIGHGTQTSFWLSGQEALGGRALSYLIEDVLEQVETTEEFVLYINSCVNFQNSKNAYRPDSGFETQLRQGLSRYVSKHQKPVQIRLIGHRGQAGFIGWWKPWFYNHFLKIMGLKPNIQTAEQIKKTFRNHAIAGAFLSLPFMLLDFHSLFYSLSLPVSFASLSSLSTFLYWHHMSKLGRVITLSPIRSTSDDSPWMHNALKSSVQEPSCVFALEAMGLAAASQP